MNPDALDLVVIGGGKTGSAIASACIAAGLRTAVVDIAPAPANCHPIESFAGRGFTASARTVAVLDPRTGDELRILHTRAIVVATGSDAGMTGLAKLGVLVDPTTGRFQTGPDGATIAPGVFAAGSCAISASTLGPAAVATSIVHYLQTTG